MSQHSCKTWVQHLQQFAARRKMYILQQLLELNIYIFAAPAAIKNTTICSSCCFIRCIILQQLLHAKM
jgi:hypothetical protein